MAAAEVAVPATAIPCRTGARSSGGRPSRKIVRVSSARLCSSAGGRGVGVDVAFAHSHHARLEGGVEAGGAVAPDDELGGAAADVDHDGGLRGVLAVGHRAEERELGLLVPGERAGVEAVVAAHALRERGPVGRVAHGGGEHREVGLAAVAVDQRAVVGEHSAGPLDSLGGEPPVRVHARAEAGDAREAHKLGHGPLGCDVGDEQAGGVGADVDHGDAHGRGWYRGICTPRPRGSRRRRAVAAERPARRGEESS